MTITFKHLAVFQDQTIISQTIQGESVFKLNRNTMNYFQGSLDFFFFCLKFPRLIILSPFNLQLQV